MSDEDNAFDEKTAVTGGIRSLDDYVTCLKLLQAGKNDEALFTFQLSHERLKQELTAWDQRVKDPTLAAEFRKKMS